MNFASSLLRDRSGFTLIELMIGGTVMILGVVGVMSTMQMSMRAQNSARSSADIDQMNTQALIALSDQASCEATFQSLTAWPTGTGFMPLNDIKRKTSSGTIAVLTKRTSPPKGQSIYVSDIRLYGNGEVEIKYAKTGANTIGGNLSVRRITAPVLWNGTRAVCSESSSNVDAAFKTACEANGGFYDISKPEPKDRCVRCPSGQYNSAASGAPLSCKSIAQKGCEALGSSVAYWEASSQTCRMCSKAGQILKKSGSGAFNEATDCVDSIDQTSLVAALNCVGTVSFSRTAHGTLVGKCTPPPPVPPAPPPPPPPPPCVDSRTDAAVKAEFCVGSDAVDACGKSRGGGTKNDPYACNGKLVYAVHTVKQCVDQGGTLVNGPLGDSERFCRFKTAKPVRWYDNVGNGGGGPAGDMLGSDAKFACPSGWTPYQRWGVYSYNRADRWSVNGFSTDGNGEKECVEINIPTDTQCYNDARNASPGWEELTPTAYRSKYLHNHSYLWSTYGSNYMAYPVSLYSYDEGEYQSKIGTFVKFPLDGVVTGFQNAMPKNHHSHYALKAVVHFFNKIDNPEYRTCVSRPENKICTRDPSAFCPCGEPFFCERETRDYYESKAGRTSSQYPPPDSCFPVMIEAGCY